MSRKKRLKAKKDRQKKSKTENQDYYQYESRWQNPRGKKEP